MPYENVSNYISKKHDCHTVILYGSRADGTHDTSSDYDILAIRDRGDFEKDCGVFEGCYLDAFIYSEGNIFEPDSFLIRIKNGIVLAQKNKIGDELLAQVTKIFEQGPEKTPVWEKQEIMSWLPKMLERAKRNDIEGNYRRHWLQTELLKCYFRLRDMWYLGPKKSFAWLEKNDSEIFDKFHKALQANASFTSIDELILQILAGHHT